MDTVLRFLDKHNIKYTLHEHQAVFTCEDALEHGEGIGGVDCKNLFLKGRDGGVKKYFLLSLPINKRANIKSLAKTFGVSRVSFASEEELWEQLRLKPGSVSPFGLLNNTDGGVEYYLDSEVAEADVVAFHPNVNTATLDVTQEDFRRYLRALGKEVNSIEV